MFLKQVIHTLKTKFRMSFICEDRGQTQVRTSSLFGEYFRVIFLVNRPITVDRVKLRNKPVFLRISMYVQAIVKKIRKFGRSCRSNTEDAFSCDDIRIYSSIFPLSRESIFSFQQGFNRRSTKTCS